MDKLSFALQSLDSLPNLNMKEQRAAKLKSKKSKMLGVAWAIAICYKRQVVYRCAFRSALFLRRAYNNTFQLPPASFRIQHQ